MTETVGFKSSLVKCATYEPSTMQLTVTLHVGKTYGYAQVARRTWEELKASSSPGNYYNRTLRKCSVALGESQPLGGFEKMSAEQQGEFKAMCDQIDEIEKGVREYREKQDDPFADADDFFDGGEMTITTTSTEMAIIPPTKEERTGLMKAAAWIPEERLFKLRDDVKVYADRATAITINSPEALLLAEDIFKNGKDLFKVLAEELQPVTASYFKSWKEAKENENSVLQPLDEATNKLSKVIYAYRKETERLVQQAQQQAITQAKTEGTIFASRVETLPPSSGTSTRKKLVAVVDSLEDLILQVAEGIQKRRAGGSDAGYPPVGSLQVHQATLNAQVKGRDEGQYCPGVRIIDDGSIQKSRGRK